jgi:hypothetical protein
MPKSKDDDFHDETYEEWLDKPRHYKEHDYHHHSEIAKKIREAMKPLYGSPASRRLGDEIYNHYDSGRINADDTATEHPGKFSQNDWDDSFRHSVESSLAYSEPAPSKKAEDFFAKHNIKF